jgi:uroporphyrinogen-III synthase
METTGQPDKPEPLDGQTVVVTRMRDQAADLSAALKTTGAEVVEAPTIELGPVDDYNAVDEALRRIGDYHWVVLTSSNGADALLARLETIGMGAKHLSNTRVAAIGPATARRLLEHGIQPDLIPPEAIGESVAEALIATGIRSRRVLLLAADIARPQLAEALRSAGAACDSLAVYRTRRPDALPAEFLDRLDRGRIDWITLTSPSSFTNLLALLGPQRSEHLRKIRLASIGPVTTRAIREAGYDVAAEAEPHDVPGLVSAIINASARV